MECRHPRFDRCQKDHRRIVGILLPQLSYNIQAACLVQAPIQKDNICSAHAAKNLQSLCPIASL